MICHISVGIFDVVYSSVDHINTTCLFPSSCHSTGYEPGNCRHPICLLGSCQPPICLLGSCQPPICVSLVQVGPPYVSGLTYTASKIFTFPFFAFLDFFPSFSRSLLLPTCPRTSPQGLHHLYHPPLARDPHSTPRKNSLCQFSEFLGFYITAFDRALALI